MSELFTPPTALNPCTETHRRSRRTSRLLRPDRLLVLTVGAAFVDLWGRSTSRRDGDRRRQGGPDRPVLHARALRQRLVWVFSGAAFLWLPILIVLTLNDYFTRGWLNIPGK